ncbi:MAG: 50S ribosomal protein L9 [Gammaproteobacteria bacterium]
MEIILLENIDNLGGIGDKVTVKPGYGRNYLVPQGKATLATAANLAKFEARRAELEAKAQSELDQAQQRVQQLEGIALTITAKSGGEGKLFGSIGTVDIAELCTAQGIEVQRSEVRLPDGPIRTTGEHNIEFHIYTDVDVSATITVIGEE